MSEMTFLDCEGILDEITDLSRMKRQLRRRKPSLHAVGQLKIAWSSEYR